MVSNQTSFMTILTEEKKTINLHAGASNFLLSNGLDFGQLHSLTMMAESLRQRLFLLFLQCDCPPVLGVPVSLLSKSRE